MSCHLFYGEDDFSAYEAYRRVAAETGPAEELATNTTTFDGEHASFGEVAMAARAMPFLGAKRLVVVEGLGRRLAARNKKAGGGDGKDGGKDGLKDWAGLADLVSGLPPTTVLIFLDGALTAGSALVKAVRAAKGEVKVFNPLRDREVAGWIADRAKAKGASIAGPAVQMLAGLVGGNLRLLDGEIDKLATYAQGRTIERADVEALVSQAKETSIFELVDAVATRRQGPAMRALERLLTQGAPPPVAMTMLARQLRLMTQVKALAARNAGDDEIMAAMGTRSDFVVRKTKEQARSYSLDALKQLYERLLDTDLAIKTGAVSDELGLEMFVAEASAPSPSTPSPAGRGRG